MYTAPPLVLDPAPIARPSSVMAEPVEKVATRVDPTPRSAVTEAPHTPNIVAVTADDVVGRRSYAPEQT